MSQQRKKGIFILGMHRSGTSAMAGALQILGVELGKDLMAANEFNEKGYFENNNVYRLHEDVLSGLGISWDQTFLLDDDWKSHLSDSKYSDRVQEIAETDYTDCSVFAVKDPRLSMLLPVWQPVLQNPNVDSSFIIMFRHPMEIWKSLNRRENFSLEKALMIWMDHMLAADEHTRERDRIFIDYQQLLNDPISLLSQIIATFQLGLDETLEENSEKIRSFINASLRHHKVSEMEQQNLPPHYQDLVSSLEKAVIEGQISAQSQAEMEEIRIVHQREIKYYARPFLEEARDAAEKIKIQTLEQLNTARAAESEALQSLEAITRKNVEIKRKLAELSSEIKEQAQSNLEMSNEIDQLQTELKAFQREAIEVKEEIDQKNQKIQQLQEDIRLSYEIRMQLSQQLSNQSRSVASLNNLRIDLEKRAEEVEQLKTALDERLGHARDQERRIRDLITQNEEKAEALSSLRRSLSFQIGDFLTMPFRWIILKLSPGNPIKKSNAWLFLYFLITFLKSPIRMASNLNLRNLQTLFRAIGNEHSMEIVQNLQSLLIHNGSRAAHDNRDAKGKQKISERENSVKPRPQLLYVSPNLPDFDSSSGGKRATRMLGLLAEHCDVYVFSIGERPRRYRQVLEDLGLSVIDHHDLNLVKRDHPRMDTIIFAWYYSYSSAQDLINLYPNARIIMDSVDVHWVREARSTGLVEGLTEQKVLENKQSEITAYRAADVVWAVTEPDRDSILKEIPDADVRIVSNIHEPQVTQFREKKTTNILFFGGYQHVPNVSAAILLAKEIFPLIRSALPKARLIIAGSKAPESVVRLGELEGVDFIGFVKESVVADLYARSSIAIAPLLSGAGIKGKICEAISYLTPVLTNAIGNEGIDLQHGINGFIADDPQEIAEIAIDVLSGKYDLKQITRSAQEHLATLVSPPIVEKSMLNSLFPSVTICIVTFNRLDLLKDCIESILANTAHPVYRIAVHSNGCKDGTQKYLQALAATDERVIPILSDKNEVFVKPNNRMMERFGGDDIVLLNNDTTVTKGWLLGLYRAAYISERVGIAGSKLLYPDGRLQEFGSELFADGTGRNIGKGDDPSQSDYLELKYVPYVSGCAMYIKRTTIEQLGVFDEQFHPCYCEDSDYCYSAWEKDIETVVTPHSVVIHHEGATGGTDVEQGFKRHQETNMIRFLEKHKDSLTDVGYKIRNQQNNSSGILDRIKLAAEQKYQDLIGAELLLGTQLNGTSPLEPDFQSVASFEDYLQYKEEMQNVLMRRQKIETDLCKDQYKDFDVWGYNFMIDKVVPFRVTVGSASHKGVPAPPNFRESLICPETGTNSRLRTAAYFLESADLDRQTSAYFTEQISTFYGYYRTRLKLAGSELVAHNLESGTYLNGIRHEDPEMLSFPDKSFDLLVSLDLLQHVSDYHKALKEFARCLRPGGKLLLSLPFIFENRKNTVRAVRKEDGSVDYRLPPIFYPNQLHRQEGLLCYHHFGWDLLEEICSCGFEEVSGKFLWSLYHGVLGENFLISATRTDVNSDGVR